MRFNKIGVVGLGVMGSGIVEVFARENLDVVALADSGLALDLGKENLANSIQRAISKGVLTRRQADEISNRITWTTEFTEMSDCDLVIEAVPEVLGIKHHVFAHLDEVVSAQCVLATNTSSFSVTEIAQNTRYPARVIGMHFFNPAPIQEFVELVKTPESSPAIIQEIAGLTELIRKQYVVVNDEPGFIANRLLLTYLNHAALLADDGVATYLEIDVAMRDLGGYPLGPFELLDLIGIDTAFEILQTLQSRLRDEKFTPAISIRSLFAEEKFGRKSNVGFYDYPRITDTHSEMGADLKAQIFLTLQTALHQSAKEMAASEYASEADIDLALKLGCGFPKGLFES